MSDVAQSGLCVVALYDEPDTYFVNGERVSKDTYEAVKELEDRLVFALQTIGDHHVR